MFLMMLPNNMVIILLNYTGTSFIINVQICYEIEINISLV